MLSKFVTILCGRFTVQCLQNFILIVSVKGIQVFHI